MKIKIITGVLFFGLIATFLFTQNNKSKDCCIIKEECCEKLEACCK